jgi:hypothetical protein
MMTMMMMTVIMGVIALLTLDEGILSTMARSNALSQAHVYSSVLRNLLLPRQMRISLISFEVLLP